LAAQQQMKQQQQALPAEAVAGGNVGAQLQPASGIVCVSSV
jgi:hypothetical protein